ncbi:hypothetical protein GCM10027346_36410 [Hymenobacter seoulensis]
MSPDLWVVPGPDPEGAPGSPIVGQPCFLWARVRNGGSSGATNATVRYYWANPAVGFNRTSAHLVGSSFVTLAPGEAREVLCLTPWHPEFVNNGHECILGEVFLPGGDPLPNSPAFNVPTDRHVAQRNLSVITTAQRLFSFSFAIHNTQRQPGSFGLKLSTGTLDQLKPLLPQLDRRFHVAELPGKLVRHAFTSSPCASSPLEEQLRQAFSPESIPVAAGQRVGLTLVGEIADGATLIHVEQLADNIPVGGLSVLVIPDVS